MPSDQTTLCGGFMGSSADLDAVFVQGEGQRAAGGRGRGIFGVAVLRVGRGQLRDGAPRELGRPPEEGDGDEVDSVGVADDGGGRSITGVNRELLNDGQ